MVAKDQMSLTRKVRGGQAEKFIPSCRRAALLFDVVGKQLDL